MNGAPRGGAFRSLAAGGALLLVFALGLTLLSTRFEYGRSPSLALMLSFVGTTVVAGMIYLVTIRVGSRAVASRSVIAAVVVVGYVMRAVVMFSTPILEDDVYRYLWDGAATASGLDPYRTAPADARSNTPVWAALTDDAGEVHRRINYPHLRTIYPPVAQTGFAVAHLIGPWRLWSWRLVLLAADSATLVLLLLCLRRLDLSAMQVAVYWWNPLVLKELFNASHMDGLALPLVIGAIYLAMRRRTALSMALLAMAVATKVWPIVLAPILLRRADLRRRRAMVGVIVFTACCLLLLSPMLAAGLDADSGLRAYAASWQNNAGIFAVIEHSVGLIVDPSLKPAISRSLVAMALVAWIGWLARRQWEHPSQLVRRCMLAAAGVFLLSPTQFPWYFTWVVPLLALAPYTPLLLYTVLLPLYHLTYLGNVFIVAQHVPVAVAIATERVRSVAGSRRHRGPVHA